MPNNFQRKPTGTELVFILDKSGSMSGLESDTIGGFNSMLNQQKKLAGKCRVTTVLFNERMELLHDRIDLEALSPLTEEQYVAGGMTALNDAVGRTIKKIINVQKQTNEAYQADRVLFVIITDGYENSSREYTDSHIRNLIKKVQREYEWEVIFLGANMDANEVADNLGINEDYAVDYLADEEGTKLNFETMNKAVEKVRSGVTLDAADFLDIKEDVKNRSQKK